jgi:hypothetical protein
MQFIKTFFQGRKFQLVDGLLLPLPRKILLQDAVAEAPSRPTVRDFRFEEVVGDNFVEEESEMQYVLNRISQTDPTATRI